jgi:hypothetical protein
MLVMLAAINEGLCSAFVAAFDDDQVRAVLGLPQMICRKSVNSRVSQSGVTGSTPWPATSFSKPMKMPGEVAYGAYEQNVGGQTLLFVDWLPDFQSLPAAIQKAVPANARVSV